ncbi:LON peptidase substrate-binding domain-containing protein [Nocardioides sp. CBS4Y-1]|uniref:LON peptidase substrate-binding domain-containing protein n=2 Tax=Nocardioides acrostichi TaxID=2784339 RepID=A0A930Y676_9ACTN|nr:LON peptidase substrate-binding domain-containing protein [Nocardioides acrostichi]
MFPLNSVLFPGMTVPLRVFEDRYRALVHHLLRIEDPADRLFGSVGIREGYEVGDHGAQSLYRCGVRLQLTECERHDDGTFSIEAVAHDRINLEHLDPRDAYPVGHVDLVSDDDVDASPELVERARATLVAYAAALAQLRPTDLGSAPGDPYWLSWVLAAAAPLPMPDRQMLLECTDTAERLGRGIDLLRGELRAMNVIPSLPASEVGRTRWSPN